MSTCLYDLLTDFQHKSPHSKIQVLTEKKALERLWNLAFSATRGVARTCCGGDASEILDASALWKNKFDSQLQQVLCETRFPSQDGRMKDKDHLAINIFT